jgi:hypothetical protein
MTMKILIQTALAAAMAMGASSIQAADGSRVQVRFVGDTSTYADLGEGASDRESNLSALKVVFQGLSSRLPAGQTLDVVVSDVNLAGELEWMRSAQRLRVMRNIGWPMVQLSYTLKEGDRVLRQGEERVTDIDYLSTRPLGVETQRLGYEERMLQEWLRRVLSPR